ncbi:MAG TPA: NAD-dependent epimerase/dehydratase family protein [Actinomycetales bacterium]|nr:NAD-dependent epimerase/dehydratase family protein [Actinomycetales bacterium]
MTNAASPVGRAVTDVLARAVGNGIGSVVAVDGRAVGEQGDERLVDRPGEGAVGEDALRWRRADIATPSVADALAGADVVVHLAIPDDLEGALFLDPHRRRTDAVRSAQAVLTAAAAVGARHVVVVTSAMVFGARPDSPVPLPEDGPLEAVPDDGVVGDLLEVEQVVARVRETYPGLAVTSLRPAAIVGPGVDTLTTRHFEAPRLLAVRDAPTLWQFCHVDDLARAVLKVVQDGLTGQLTVGAPGTLTEDEVGRLSGMRRIDVPRNLAFGTAERLHRVGVLRTPATELNFVVHPWVVSSSRLTDAGWRAEYDNEQCLRVLLEQVTRRKAATGRRIERSGTALGAAGAAVALVGTAAVWRQAKARQGRRRG